MMLIFDINHHVELNQILRELLMIMFSNLKVLTLWNLLLGNCGVRLILDNSNLLFRPSSLHH